MILRTNRTRRLTAATLGATVLVAGMAAGSSALTAPGTSGKDVHFGGDDDNAANTLIHPPGVSAKQHMDDTDVLFGRDNDDLLIGRLGADTLLGGEDDDILIGGPEDFSAPNSDVLIGEEGNDIIIWSPGDGSEAALGNEGHDTMIFAPFSLRSNGDPRLTTVGGRKIPHVEIDSQPTFSCSVVKVPASRGFGFQHLVRFKVNGTIAVTVRQKDVETVYCPSPQANRAKVADLTSNYPTFSNVPLAQVPGTVGAIMDPSW